MLNWGVSTVFFITGGLIGGREGWAMDEGWMDAMERCRGIETAPCLPEPLPRCFFWLTRELYVSFDAAEKNDSCWVWEGNLT